MVLFELFTVLEMESEGVLQISAASVVEEVLQQHGSRFCDIDFASRRAEEAGLIFLPCKKKKKRFDFLLGILWLL